MASAASIRPLTGNAILPFMAPLKQLRTVAFQQYPYLLQMTNEYNQDYLQQFVMDKHAMIALLEQDHQILAAVSGIPLLSDAEGILKQARPLLQQNIC